MVVMRAQVLGATLVVAACAGGSSAEETAPTSTILETSSAPTTVVSTTTTTVVPTTTIDPLDELRDPACVVTVAAGDSISKIADEVGAVTMSELLAENWLSETHVLHPGDQLDVCIGNDVDDVTGASRLAPGPAAVRRQQERLNELFAPYQIAELAVDGDSGPLTRQMLCAARMGLGLPISAAHMAAGGPEEEALFEAETLAIPAGAATWANRWILIDKTCQVMFTGEGGDRVVNVFPTSTGESGFETRDVGGVAAFRFDPAADNGGWHDSSRFPVAIDNPLNGNMYKPIYFSGGQAIHGANNVPPSPRSKGCARMFTWHHDAMLRWLGLDDVTEPTWRRDQIGVVVTTQGDHRPID